MESDTQQNPEYTKLLNFREEIMELVRESEEQEKHIERLSKPDWTLAPAWVMTCVLAYLYGLTLGLYMCSK
jgi:hypothetical protein